MNPKIVLLISFISAFLSFSAADETSKVPAFPGAEGFGASALGGRGGRVVEVTTLANDGPGSLRQACYAEGPRIVVFRIGGLIELQTDIKISNPFLTIAGQSAPGDGICLKSGTLRVCTHDVVIRFIRARVGDGPSGVSPENRDALKIEGSDVHNIMVDHCSFSWAIDENVSTWATPHDITIQWCIVAEGLLWSLHPKSHAAKGKVPHSMGLLIGRSTNRVTIHHCLMAHNNMRNPLLQIDSVQSPSDLDCRNNVVYNFGTCASVAAGNIRLNYMGNYLKRGTNSTSEKELAIDLDRKGSGGCPQVFLAGNIGPNNLDGRDDNWKMVWDMKTLGEGKVRVKEPFPFPGATTEDAHASYEAVLLSAGATRPVRDAVDARIVKDVREGTGRIINSTSEVGGWPEYRSAAPLPDSDHDGIPDEWETAHGLNPNDPSDGPKDKDGDGYTNVEEFLNETQP
ncbi:MAG: pectate lyase [Planctomycetota bacterium]